MGYLPVVMTRVPPRVSDLVDAMERIAPTRLAAPWDNVGLLVGDTIFVKAIGHIVFYGKGVKESGFLKDHTDARAKFEEVGLTHAGNVLAEDANRA